MTDYDINIHDWDWVSTAATFKNSFQYMVYVMIVIFRECD